MQDPTKNPPNCLRKLERKKKIKNIVLLTNSPDLYPIEVRYYANAAFEL